MQRKLWGLDHLRALAIILVFLFHYGRLFPHPEWTHTICKFGWTGVDLFFVLSGYLISSHLFARVNNGKPISVSDFYIKRFFRIIPAYLCVVIIYFSFPVVWERGSLAPAWRYLTFTQNYGLDLSRHGTFSHAWSLCIEEQFYFCLPLFLVALQHFRVFKNSYWILVVLLLAGIVVRFLCYTYFITPSIGVDDAWKLSWYKWIYYPTFCRLDGLLVGIGIAALFEFRPGFKDRIGKYGNHLFLLSLVVLAAAYFICYDETSVSASVFGFPVVALGYGLMVAGAICPSCFLYQHRSSITTHIATLSYAIYLVHKMVIHLTQKICIANHLAPDSSLVFIICIITIIAAALLMNKLIEKPFLRLRNRYSNALKARL